ncbi:MerR family transcriptional regulator [Nakamurella aerolata]|uniref:MerR family transcriptional regulator n=1 Tax=Nakamurella aerolata TaxID=1656892 RepID=A0A849AAC5_9ACTN|nr:MerR family transcriptional regulator [Nakamurella aerolata]NNG36546.1 MerR family transcriptional regulator [Nakamurella aerolata]
MQVAELARRAGASPRSIRHYDRAQLLSSRRLANGYRVFDEAAVDEVRRLRSLLAAGLSLADISTIRPCLDPDGSVQPCAVARRVLREHADRLRARIAADRRTLKLLQEKLSASAG